MSGAVALPGGDAEGAASATGGGGSSEWRDASAGGTDAGDTRGGVGCGAGGRGAGDRGAGRGADFATVLRGVIIAGDGASRGTGVAEVGITGAGGAIRRTLRVAGAEGGTWAGGPPRPDSASSPAAWAPATKASDPHWTDENRLRAALPPDRADREPGEPIESRAKVVECGAGTGTRHMLRGRPATQSPSGRPVSGLCARRAFTVAGAAQEFHLLPDSPRHRSSRHLRAGRLYRFRRSFSARVCG